MSSSTLRRLSDRRESGHVGGINNQRKSRRVGPIDSLRPDSWEFIDSLTLQQKCSHGKNVKKRNISFKEAARKIQTGQKLSHEIMGSLKGRLLSGANLGQELEIQAAQKLGWTTEHTRRLSRCSHPSNSTLKPKELKAGPPVSNPTLDEESLNIIVEFDDDDEEIYTLSDSFDEFLRNPYGNFVRHADEASYAEQHEDATNIMTGLKSWLNFGTSVAQNPLGDQSAEYNRKKPLWETMGRDRPTPGPDLSAATVASLGGGSGRKIAGLMEKVSTLTKGDDQMMKRAEDQASRRG